MRSLGKHGRFTFHMVKAGDATRGNAFGIMRIERNAYKGRFPTVPLSAIDSTYKTDPEDDAHVRHAIECLRDGRWYWVIAKSSGVMRSFGLFEIEGRTIEVLELHTDPEGDSQRKGLASTVLYLGLKHAQQQLGAEHVALAVDIAPRSRHPYAWCARLGFNRGNLHSVFELGKLRLEKYKMAASLPVVLGRLTSRALDVEGERK